MDEPQIYGRLAAIFQDVFDEDSITMTPELSAKDVNGWDSLTHIRLMLTVEKAFRVKFSTSEIGKMETVGDLVTIIKARIQDAEFERARSIRLPIPKGRWAFR